MCLKAMSEMEKILVISTFAFSNAVFKLLPFPTLFSKTNPFLLSVNAKYSDD